MDFNKKFKLSGVLILSICILFFVDLVTVIFFIKVSSSSNLKLVGFPVLIGVNSFFCISILLISFLYIKNIIGGELEYSIKMMEIMSHGDFSNPIKSHSKAGLLHSMEFLRNEIFTTISKLSKNYSEIEAEINSVSSTSTALSELDNKRKDSIMAKAEFMMKIDNFYKENSRISKKISKNLTFSSDSLSTHGGQLMKRVRTSMAEISYCLERLDDISVPMDFISFQTNVLALNASIEADISVEKESGPSTLAREARVLANNSLKSVKDVRILVAEITEKIRCESSKVDQAVMDVINVIEKIGQTSDLFSEIGIHASKQKIIISNAEEIDLNLKRLDYKNTIHLDENMVSFANLSMYFEHGKSFFEYFNINDFGCSR